MRLEEHQFVYFSSPETPFAILLSVVAPRKLHEKIIYEDMPYKLFT
jgi:hypothetical protein